MNDPAAKTVLVCDTQPVAIEGLRGLLERSPGLRFLGAVATLDAALELARTMAPSAILIDKALGSHTVSECLRQLSNSTAGTPTAAVVWGVGITEWEALRLLQDGARGVLRRTSEPETIVTCLQAVTSGSSWIEDGIFSDAEKVLGPRRSPLTPRELEVALEVQKGLRNRDIAINLGIRTGTVKIHLKHIFEKTGVHGRYGLALNGLREKGTIAASAL